MVSEVAKDWVFEVTCTGPADRGPAVRAEVNAGTRGWAGLRGMTTIDVYSPAADDACDPFNDDGAGPLFIAMVAFGTRDALQAALETAPLGARIAEASPGLAYTCTAFERHAYPVAGEAKPAPLRARFSYVVRYHKPAEDEAAFIRNYVDTHPPTLATLPGIRSVMCYFPLPIAAPGVMQPTTSSATRLRSTASQISTPRCNLRCARSCAVISTNSRRSQVPTRISR